MPTDPIKLINKIFEPTTTTAPKKTDATPTTAAAATTTTAQSAKDYVLSQSLNSMLSKAGGTRTQELATYSAKGLAESFKKASEAQMADKKPATNPMDDILASSRKAGTNAPQLSAEAQASIQKGTKATADAGLNTIDKKLAQVVGISRAIGSA